MATVELEIPPRSAYVGVARLAIVSLARAAGLEEEVVDSLKIAVSEACANAVLSSEESGAEERITVGWAEERDRITVEVGDPTAAYEPDAPQDVLDSQGFSSRLVMSVSLIKALVDETQFSAREGGGMNTRLVISK